MEERPDFGDYLIRIMRYQNISTSELARRLEARPSTVSKWRLGQYRPNTWYCRRIAEELNLDPAEVMVMAGHADPRELSDDPIKQQLHILIDALPSDLLEPYVPVFDRLLHPGGKGDGEK